MKPSISLNSFIRREKLLNKKLVRILNFKMFKGYRISKESQKVSFSKPPSSLPNFLWENKTIDPFDDLYNIEYKRKNLSSLFPKDFSNLLEINNIPKTNSKKRKLIKKMNVQTQKGKFFLQEKEKEKNTEKNPITPEEYFYFCSNPQFSFRNPKENKEHKEKLYNTIFQDRNEKGLYNDIPIFAIEKIYKSNNNKNKNKFKYLKSKEERVSDLQFLYKVSHEKPRKKIDFSVKYNIKNTKNNILENEMIRNLSCNLKSNSVTNNIKLMSRKNTAFINDYNNVNNSMNIKNINNDLKRNFSYISKNKSVIEMGTQKNEFYLRKSPSSEDLFNNESKIINKHKQNDRMRKSYSSLYPINRRIINIQLLKQQMEFQKWKFNNLKNLMEV